MNTLLSDVRYSFRTLAKSPGFTSVAIATLALAIGANTAIFTFVNAVMLKPLPYNHPERIVRVLEAPPGGGRNGISTLNFLDWQAQNSVFEFLAARNGGSIALTGVAEPVQLPGARVSSQYFSIFGVKAALGRTFVEGEDKEGKDHVAVLNHSLWQSQFGGDPAIIGRTIHLDGEAYTVIGVLSKDSPFERGYARIWRPLTFKPDNMTRNFHWFGAFARLKPGVTLEQARAQMDAIGRRIATDFPDSNKGWGVGVDLLSESIAGGQLKQSLWVLLSAVGMVLLIACANLANLSLMRVTGREREIAVRVALGAGRGVLMRQFLTESLLVSVVGGAAGVLVGQLATISLKLAMPPFALPSEADVTLDWRVLLFSFALTLITGVAIGLIPALQAARPNLTNSLKQGGVGGSAGARSKTRAALVVAEVTLAFVLLTGAGLLLRSLDKLRHMDLGFNPDNVLTFGLPVSGRRYPDVTALNSYLREVSARLSALPGVKDVALSSALPMQGWGYGMPYLVDGREKVDRANRKSGFFKMVSPSYFQTIGMHVIKGRALAPTDRNGAPPAMVINEAMAKQCFPNENPLGKRILVQEIVPNKAQLGDEIGWEVVGVVANEIVSSLDDNPDNNPGMYVPQDQSPAYYLGIMVHGNGDTALLREPIKQAIHALSPDQTLPEMKTLETIRDESLGNNRFRTLLFGSFAVASLLLSAVGIFGVISYSVSQRTREIGIRTALGASKADVIGLVLRQGLAMAALGLVLGIGGSLALSQFLGSLLFNIPAYDPITLAAVAVLLAIVSTLACLLPARRAAQVSPLVALRSE